jgi:signal transduction histidine kinase
MASVPFQRHRSSIEALGIAFALCIAIASILGAVGSMWSFILEPFSQAWGEFSQFWQTTFVGAATVLLTLGLLPRRLPQRRWLRWPGLVFGIAAAGALGWFSEDLWSRFAFGAPMTSDSDWPAMVHSIFVLAGFIGALGEYRWRSVRAAAALHEANLDRIRLEGELAQGRLHVLEAQIEPHFLFNSLANVRRLLRTDGEAGRAMLADLMRYLESALPRMRADSSTLAREAELIRAFLAVHQVRMGARLQVDIDVPAELGGHVVPPMMLLTLIENALKHGLAPLPEGGSIKLSAAEAGGKLVLGVADTGRGLVAGAGGGTGLANIRARLKAMYGPTAGLSLRLNDPRGLVAEIRLPAEAG